MQVSLPLMVYLHHVRKLGAVPASQWVYFRGIPLVMSPTSRTERRPCSRVKETFISADSSPKKSPVKKYPDDCTSYVWSLLLLLKYICLKLITPWNHAEIIFGSFGKTSHTFLLWYTLLLYLLVSHQTVNVKVWTCPAGFSFSVCTSTWEECWSNVKV